MIETILVSAIAMALALLGSIALTPRDGLPTLKHSREIAAWPGQAEPFANAANRA